MNTTLKKIYDSNLSHRRLQAFVRQTETLQGLACVPYRGESAFIDRVLQEWLINACHPHSVEEMRENGELTKIITAFLEGKAVSEPDEAPVKKKTVKTTAPSKTTQAVVEESQAIEEQAHETSSHHVTSAPSQPVELPKEQPLETAASPIESQPSAVETPPDKKDEGPAPDPTTFLNMF